MALHFVHEMSERKKDKNWQHTKNKSNKKKSVTYRGDTMQYE